MKTKVSPKKVTILEKKDGGSMNNIEETFQIFQKENSIENQESIINQNDLKPETEISPLKQNIKVMVIPCNNIVAKNENFYVEEKGFKMDLEINRNIQEITKKEEIKKEIILENSQNQQENKELNQNILVPAQQKNLDKDQSNIGNLIPPNYDIENIDMDLCIPDIQSEKDEKECKPLTNEPFSDMNIINDIIKQNLEETMKIENLDEKEKEKTLPGIKNEQNQITANDNIINQQNENKSNKENNTSNENINDNISKESCDKINVESEEIDNLPIADVIRNLVDGHLNRINEEEMQKKLNSESKEEDQKDISLTNDNNEFNDMSIHPGSPSLSKIVGINAKEEGVSIFSGNNYPDEIVEEMRKNLSNKCLIGLPNKDFFINKYLNNYNNILYNPYDYKYQDVKDDGNCGYRCIALQLLGNEEFHNDIRMDVYNFLRSNKENFTHLTFQIDGVEVKADEYIEHIKNPGFEMGDLELYVMNIIYNAILFIFQLKDEDELSLIHIKGNLKDSNCILLTLCIVDEDHFNVVYEKYRGLEEPRTKKNNLKIDMESIIKKALITDINIAYELNYADDKRKYRYKDMINYMISKKFNREPTYPDFIYDIKTKQLRTNKKKEFKKSLKNYFIDEKTKRLKVKFNFNKVKELINKEYFIPFQMEKIKLIKQLHNSATHKGQPLSELVKKSDYWWYGVYQDVKNSVNFCPLCQKRAKTKMIKPRPFFNRNLYSSSSNVTTPSKS